MRELPLAIVKAKIRNFEILFEKGNFRWEYPFYRRIGYYKKLQRKMELEQFFNVKLPDA